MWWTFIWWGWEETPPMYPRCLAHTCHYGLLPSRSKHSSGQLAHCGLQVTILPMSTCSIVSKKISPLTVFTHWSACPVPQQHLLWSQVNFQPSVEVPEISADHDFPWPSHFTATSHHPQPPLYPLQQDVQAMCQEETGGRARWERPWPQLVSFFKPKQFYHYT